MTAITTATMKDIMNAMTKINQVHFVSYAGHDADTAKPTEHLVTIWSSCYYCTFNFMFSMLCFPDLLEFRWVHAPKRSWHWL